MTPILLLAALAAPAPAAAATAKDSFVYAHVGEISSFDPHFPYDAISQGAILNVYDTLIAFKGASLKEFEPAIAAKVPSLDNGLISRDGRTYTFPIRQGVTFHDGSKLTPEDVRWSLLRFLLMDRAGGPSSLLLEPILGVPSTRGKDGELRVTFEDAAKAVRVEGGNVVVTLARPFGPFLSIMARWSYVLDKESTVKAGGWDGTAATWKKFNNPEKADSALFERANGTGPYRLERWDASGRKLWLKAFEGHWRGAPALKTVLMTTVDEFSTRKLLLQGGDADLIDVPRPFARLVDGLDGVVVVDDLPRLMTDPVLFFTLDVNPVANPDIGSGRLDGKGIPPDFFRDRDLRRAFAHAIDYDAVIEDAFRGKAVRARNAVPPELAGSDPEAPAYTFDMKKAEQYFRKARGGEVWEKGFQFTLTYNTGSEMREVACNMLKRNVEKLNPKFRVDVRGIDWAAYLDKTRNRMMPMFARGWIADYPSIHNFVFPFYHSQGRYPLAQGFQNAQMDRLIEQALREVNKDKRAALYARLLKLAYEEAPDIPVVHPVWLYAMRAALRGFVDNPVHMGPQFRGLSK